LRHHNSPPIRPCWRSFPWSPAPFLPRHTVPLLLFSTIKLPRHSTPYSELGLIGIPLYFRKKCMWWVAI
jgi:hypothetical protein